MAPELPIHRATYRRGSKYLEALLGERPYLRLHQLPFRVMVNPNLILRLWLNQSYATTIGI